MKKSRAPIYTSRNASKPKLLAALMKTKHNEAPHPIPSRNEKSKTSRCAQHKMLFAYKVPLQKGKKTRVHYVRHGGTRCVAYTVLHFLLSRNAKPDRLKLRCHLLALPRLTLVSRWLSLSIRSTLHSSLAKLGFAVGELNSQSIVFVQNEAASFKSPRATR